MCVKLPNFDYIFQLYNFSKIPVYKMTILIFFNGNIKFLDFKVWVTEVTQVLKKNLIQFCCNATLKYLFKKIKIKRMIRTKSFVESSWNTLYINFVSNRFVHACSSEISFFSYTLIMRIRSPIYYDTGYSVVQIRYVWNKILYR